MESETIIEASSTALQVNSFDLLTPLLQLLFGSDGILMGFSVDQALGVLGVLWSVYTVLAYIAAAIFLFLYVYASVHLEELEEHELEHIHAEEEAFARQMTGGATPNRFFEMKQHIDSDNPNDWKLAIIEADIILDETLKRQGYVGNSLGERLRSVSPQALHSLDDAWQAHKVRNEIAHSGADFVLTHKIARETIVQYERVFTELGLLGGGGSSSHGGGHH